jgi:hypothetical protein
MPLKGIYQFMKGNSIPAETIKVIFGKNLNTQRDQENTPTYRNELLA